MTVGIYDLSAATLPLIGDGHFTMIIHIYTIFGDAVRYPRTPRMSARGATLLSDGSAYFYWVACVVFLLLNSKIMCDDIYLVER